MMRKPRPTGAWIVALGALVGCGSEEAFHLQLGATERLIDTEAVAQLANQDYVLQNLRVVGDLDGDGIDDAVIVALGLGDGVHFAETNNLYVVYGGSQLHGAIDLATLPTLTMQGPSSDSVVALGDVDGDGLADFLVSAATAPGAALRNGAYLVYGSRTRLSGAAPMSSVGALLMDPVPRTNWYSLAALGDFDGDGKADFALGRPGSSDDTEQSGADEVLVFYGRSARLSGTVDPRATADATIVEPVSSTRAPDLVGAGDVDGDGRSDLIVSTNVNANSYSWHQEMRLVTGSATRLAGKVALGDVAHTRLPDAAYPPPWGIDLGVGLGDLDGDGADDFTLTTCSTPSPGEPFSTCVHHVFYGRPGGMPAQLTDADAAATVHPSFSDFRSSNFSQLIGGDIDGDGIGDLILADTSLHDSQGGVHLMRGGAQRFSGDIDPVSQSFLTYVGVSFQKPGCSGSSCSQPELVGDCVAVGDLTGDHHPEVITGARGLLNDNNGHGLSPSRTYIVSPSISRGP